MISDIGAFLDWFNGVHRRTVRDVSLLPDEAQTWRPDVLGEDGEMWGIQKLVAHIAEARGFFAGAFNGDGWIWDVMQQLPADKTAWLETLETSMTSLRASLERAGPERLAAKIPMIDEPDRSMSGWRALMMMAEHEVAHRAQIGAYAGLNGWPVAQIFDRDNEWVVAQREIQMRRSEKAD